jgi:hypothetical protein
MIVMKKITLSVLFFAIALCARSQGEYRNVMLQNIRALDTTTDAQKIKAIASTFSAIYSHKKDWLPLYYECLAYTKLSSAYENIEERRTAIDKASQLLQSLPENNDEVQVLRSFYAMKYLAIDRSEWQTYMPMINEGLSKAESINVNNPRIYYLQGLLKYNMPESMGGGQEEGVKLFQLSLQKFESYRTEDELAPSWGRKDVEKYLSNK